MNGDSTTSPIDALLVINVLNSHDDSAVEHMCDTNNDGSISPVDALMVINRLNNPSEDSRSSESSGQTESEGEHGGDPSSETGDRNSGLGLIPSVGFGNALDRVIEELFIELDSSEDGELSDEELPSFVQRLLARHGVDSNDDMLYTLDEILGAFMDHRAERFDALDQDESGTLTEDEVSHGWLLISRADTDEDSAVTIDELESFRSLSKFEKLDLDGNGSITESDVSRRIWHHLQRADANEDEMISEEELGEVEHQGPRRSLVRAAGRLLRFARRFS